MAQSKKTKIIPVGIKIISIVNLIAALLHLTFWTLGFIKLQSSFSDIPFLEKVNLATTYGFGIADLIWSFPLLIIGTFWLWKLKPLGWLAAQMANVLYWYSLTVIFIKDILSNTISPGTILFLPFCLFAFWSAFYLWKKRELFFY
jgi:hypothetical protein